MNLPSPDRHPIEAAAGVRRGRRRRFAERANTVSALLLAAAIAGMLQYLTGRHYHRADWSRAKFFSLSEKSRSLAASLTNEVEVIALFPAAHALMQDLDPLLREYEAASRLIRVRRVDPDRDLAAVEALTAEYPLTEDKVLIVSSQGRHRVVPEMELEDLDYSTMNLGQPPRRLAFKGEQAISSAIQQVAHGRTPVVYFLTGHGERSLESFERGVGYAQLARLVRQDNIDVQTLVLGERQRVPDDADAVVVAGPRRRLPQPELDALAQFLDRNGRMVLLLDSQTATGLEPLLERWDVRVGNDQVVDPARTLGGGMAISRYGRHAITDRMGELAAVVYRPRSIEPSGPGADVAEADRPRAIRLALTSDEAWGETNPAQRPPRFDAGQDRPGPVSVAVAVERGSGTPEAGADLSPTRLVVFGDSTFLTNGGMVSGNSDLFMSALNWTLDRHELMAIAPKAPEELRLDLGPRQVRRLGWLLIAGLPLAAAIAGVLVCGARRL
jgi:ABC-type uncharacterized transport system involved in gliding motility auxiliary subunit